MGQHHSPFYSPLPTQPLTQSCTWPFFLIPIPSAPLPPVSRPQKQAWGPEPHRRKQTRYRGWTASGREHRLGKGVRAW